MVRYNINVMVQKENQITFKKHNFFIGGYFTSWSTTPLISQFSESALHLCSIPATFQKQDKNKENKHVRKQQQSGLELGRCSEDKGICPREPESLDWVLGTQVKLEAWTRVCDQSTPTA